MNNEVNNNTNQVPAPAVPTQNTVPTPVTVAPVPASGPVQTAPVQQQVASATQQVTPVQQQVAPATQQVTPVQTEVTPIVPSTPVVTQPTSVQPVVPVDNQTTSVIENPATDASTQRTGKEKNKWIAFILCFFFGCIGVHKFYEGKPIMGILYIVTLGFFGIGTLIDLIKILMKPNPYYV